MTKATLGKKILDTQEKKLYYTDNEQNKLILDYKINKITSTNKDKIEQEIDFFKQFNNIASPKIARINTSEEKYTLTFKANKLILLENFLEKQQLTFTEKLKLCINLAKMLAHIHTDKVLVNYLTTNTILIESNELKSYLINFEQASQLKKNNLFLKEIPNIPSYEYIAPELTGRVNIKVDYHADYYALGILYYKIFTGVLPFENDDYLSLIHAHIAKKPHPPYTLRKDIPKAISSIIMKLIAKNPEERYQGIPGLLYDLNQCLKQLITHNKISLLKLGTHDKAATFKIPNKLYGRQNILTEIAEFTNSVNKENTKLLVFSGFSGIGKTSLVDKSFKSDNNMLFASGKFENLKSNDSYYPIYQCIDQILDHITTLPEPSFKSWKNHIIDNVGNTAYLLKDYIENLKYFIRAERNEIEGNISEVKYRFKLAITQLINTIASYQQKLILFLDDMHWADATALKLIEELINNKDNKNILLVIAYRSNEVSPSHPLVLTLNTFKELSHNTIKHIQVDDLSFDDTNLFVSETLQSKTNNVKPLTEVIYKKTNGNPFYIKQLLSTFYQNDLIFYDPQTKSWAWEIDEIQQFDVSENVIEFLKEKMQKLSTEQLTLLKIAASIGYTFSESDLSIISNSNQEKFLSNLKLLSKMGFIMKLTEQNADKDSKRTFQFIHDKIKEAAYEMASQEEKENFHFIYFRFLDENTNLKADPSSIFMLVEHMNKCLKTFKGENDSKKIIKYNYIASKKSLKSGSFEIALSLIEIANQFSENNTKIDQELKLDIELTRVKALHASGNFKKAKKILDNFIRNVKQKKSIAQAYILKINLHADMNEFNKASDVGVHALDELYRIKIRNPTPINLMLNLIRVHFKVFKKSKSDIANRPAMNNQKYREIIDIYYAMLNPTFLAKPELYPLLLLKSMLIALEYGSTDYDAYLFPAMAILEKIVGNHKYKAYFADIAKLILKKNIPANIKALTLPVIGMIIQHDFGLFKTCTPLYQDAYKYAIETGVITSISIALHQQITVKLLSGDNLNTSLKKAHEFIPIIKHFHDADEIGCMTFLEKILTALKSPRIMKDFLRESDNYDYLKKQLENPQNIRTSFIAGAFELYYYYLTEKNEKALASFNAFEKFRKDNFAPGMYYWYIHDFYGALTLIKALNQSTKSSKKKLLPYLKAITKKFKTQVKYGNPNLKNKLYLIQAEKTKYQGKLIQALKLYNKAINEAKECEFIHEEALANELAAHCCIRNKMQNLALSYLLNALQLYNQWGCQFKVKMITKSLEKIDADNLQQIIHHTLQPSDEITNITLSEKIDLETVFRASQALSKEVNPHKLVKKIIEIMLANSGANKGLLFLMNDDGYFLADNVLLEGNEHEAARFPETIVNYVVKKQVPYLGNTSKEILSYFTDNYLKDQCPQSILCIPLVRSKNLDGILYLENAKTQYSFTKKRQEILELLCVQAAISIEISRSYDAFERFVPKNFIELLGKNKIYNIALGDSIEIDITTLFCDLRNFTTISENITAKETFILLNKFLAFVAPIIKKNGGFIDKYVGDAIMALFPTHHADNAIISAIEIQTALSQLNKELINEKLIETPLQAGVGINTGTCIMGVLGSEERYDTTVISDTVNTASRIEALNKKYQTEILITNDTLDKIKALDNFEIFQVDKVIVKGKSKITTIYEVISNKEQEKLSRKKQFYVDFHEIVNDYYYKKKFNEAVDKFHELKETYPDEAIIDQYIKHCHEFMKGYNDDWEGEVKIISKE